MVGTIIESLSCDSAEFTKMYVTNEDEQHEADDSSVVAHNEASLVWLIWSRTSMVFGIPTSTPLSLMILSEIATRVGFILLLVVVLFLMGRRI